VLVRPGHGVGIASEPNPDAMVLYDGKKVTLSLREK
jgi:hypothetical protein